MKKSLFAAGLALSLACSYSHAISLKVGNTTLNGVDISSFKMTGNTLELTLASGSAQIGVPGTGPTDPDPNEPDPNEPDPNEPGPTDPEACTEGENLVCNYHIPNATENRRNIVIPKGKTLASSFTATAGKKAFSFQNLGSATKVWISAAPGSNDSLPGYFCSPPSAAFILSFSTSTTNGSTSCLLQEGNTYYINVKHDNTNQNAVTASRAYQ